MVLSFIGKKRETIFFVYEYHSLLKTEYLLQEVDRIEFDFPNDNVVLHLKEQAQILKYSKMEGSAHCYTKEEAEEWIRQAKGEFEEVE